MINRRQFGQLVAGAAFGSQAAEALAAPAVVRAKPRIVVVGGGAGGGSVAHIIKRQAPDTNVTVIEKRAIYTSCFNSNHVFGGFRTFQSLQHGYDGLRKIGIDVVTGQADAIDRAQKRVRVGDGSAIAYDYLVLSPGISYRYDAIEGYSTEVADTVMPHAWTAGPQTQLLMAQLEAMDDGGVVVMTVPKNPYRCPPGPYERACMIAHYLKTHKPRSKLLLFDAKPYFSKQAAFEEAFRKYYDGIIDLNLTDEIDDNNVVRVDPKEMTVETASGLKVRGAVVNVIPPQTAGQVAIDAGCADASGWCPIQPQNFMSAQAEGIYVIGDATIANDMPKSAYSANSHGRVVAGDILAAINGDRAVPARYRNTCWSLIAEADTIKIGADYEPGQRDGKPYLQARDAFVSLPGESAQLRRRNYDESLAWYHDIIAEALNDRTALMRQL